MYIAMAETCRDDHSKQVVQSIILCPIEADNFSAAVAKLGDMLRAYGVEVVRPLDTQFRWKHTTFWTEEISTGNLWKALSNIRAAEAKVVEDE